MRGPFAAGCESDFGSDYEEPVVIRPNNSVMGDIIRNSSLNARGDPASSIPWNSIRQQDENLVPQEDLDAKRVALKFEEHLKQMIKCADVIGIELLIDDGLEKDYSFNSGLSLISYAVFNNDFTIVEMLIKAGFRDVDKKIKSVIAICSNSYTTQIEKENSMKILELLADNKFDMDGISSDKSNSLHVAINHKNIFLIPLLVKYGADLHLRNIRQQTPLCLAVTLGQVETVKILTSFFINDQINISELSAAARIAQNVSIRSHLTSLVNEPSKIGTEVYTNEISLTTTSSDKNQLSLLLKAVGLKHLIPMFTKHSFTFKDLFKMDIQFVKKKFNLDKEEIEKLTSITNELKINSFDKNSYFVGKRNCFNSVDICISISNLYEHLEFVESSIISLCDHLQANKIKKGTTLKQAIDENFILLLQKEKSLRSSIKTFGLVKDEVDEIEDKKIESTKSYIPAKIIIGLTFGISAGFFLLKYTKT